MTIGILHVDLRIPESQSLKGKRHILLGLKTRLRQKFNISVSETDNQDKWQLATLSVACVGTDRDGVNKVLSYVEEFIRRERNVELINVELELL